MTKMTEEEADRVSKQMVARITHVRDALAKEVERHVREAEDTADMMATIIALELVMRAARHANEAQFERGLLPRELFDKMLEAYEDEARDRKIN